jgi:lysophospholipase L1-like esterase
MSEARARAASAGVDPSRALLCLGDSYTIGEGVPECGRWPTLLANWLGVDGIPVLPPTVIGRTGWTTTELSAAIDVADLAPPYDLVTLLIGVNDQYRDWPETLYPARHAALLERAVGLAGGRVSRCLAISIPDWGATPFGARDHRGANAIGAAIDRYNAVARANAEARGVVFVDITTLSRSADLAGALVEDGLHPSIEQYRAWVERAIAPATRVALTA